MDEEGREVDGFVFATLADANIAREEIKKVKYIAEKLDYQNPESILTIYNKMIVNRVALKELKDDREAVLKIIAKAIDQLDKEEMHFDSDFLQDNVVEMVIAKASTIPENYCKELALTIKDIFDSKLKKQDKTIVNLYTFSLYFVD